jgi:hypothetical protein
VNDQASTIRTLRIEIDQLQGENVTLKLNISKQQQQFSRQTMAANIVSREASAQYQEIVVELTQRVKEEQQKQAELEAMSRTITQQLTAMHDMYRKLSPVDSEWQQRRTLRTERQEIKALEQERLLLVSTLLHICVFATS